MPKLTVYLGGTNNDSQWRKEIIPLLKVNYFDPTDVDQNKKEQEQIEASDYYLFVITPKMKGFFKIYPIEELLESCNKRPEKTLFCLLRQEDKTTYTEEQVVALEKMLRTLKDYPVERFNSLADVARWLNAREQEA